MSSHSANPLHSGGCQCGRIRYALYAPPIETQICHCRMCQKATGGPFAALVMVRKSDFKWTTDQPEFYRSSNLAYRDFCAECGTPLTYRYVEGDTLDLTLGTFDDPTPFRPARELGVQSRLHWLETLGQLPTETTQSSMGDKIGPDFENFQVPDT